MPTSEPSGKRNRWLAFLSRLLELTQTGKIKWSAEPPDPRNVDADERIKLIYTTRLEGQALRLYDYQYRSYDLDSDESYWKTSIRLELIDIDGRPIYAMPPTDGLWDLLNSVRYQTANVDDFLDKVLKSPT